MVSVYSIEPFKNPAAGNLKGQLLRRIPAFCRWSMQPEKTCANDMPLLGVSRFKDEGALAFVGRRAVGIAALHRKDSGVKRKIGGSALPFARNRLMLDTSATPTLGPLVQRFVMDAGASVTKRPTASKQGPTSALHPNKGPLPPVTPGKELPSHAPFKTLDDFFVDRLYACPTSRSDQKLSA